MISDFNFFIALDSLVLFVLEHDVSVSFVAVYPPVERLLERVLIHRDRFGQIARPLPPSHFCVLDLEMVSPQLYKELVVHLE